MHEDSQLLSHDTINSPLFRSMVLDLQRRRTILINKKHRTMAVRRHPGLNLLVDVSGAHKAKWPQAFYPLCRFIFVSHVDGRVFFASPKLAQTQSNTYSQHGGQ